MTTRVAERDLAVAADHPALAGHFPGDPVVPGVLLLDLVVEVARELIGGRPLRAVPSVKFLVPLRPGQPFRIRVESRDGGRLRFSCRSQGRLAAEGRLMFAAEPPA